MKTPEALPAPSHRARNLSRTGRPSAQSTFPSRDLRTLHEPVLHSAICTLHSRNPCCTALFCAVPPNQIFSFGTRIEPEFKSGASLAFDIWKLGLSPSGLSLITSLPPEKSTFHSQVSAISNLNDF